MVKGETQTDRNVPNCNQVSGLKFYDVTIIKRI